MSLLLSSWSWVRSRKGGSVWIASSCLWGRHSPNFRTSLVFSRQTGFSECEHSPIDKSIIITEPVVASTRLLGLHGVRKCILATCHVCSTKILLDSCKVRQNTGSERTALLTWWYYNYQRTKYLSSERDFSCHGYILSDRFVCRQRQERCDDGAASWRPVFWGSSLPGNNK